MEFERTKLNDKQVKIERKIAWIFRTIGYAVTLIIRMLVIAYLSGKLWIYLGPIIGILGGFIVEQIAYAVIRKNAIEWFLQGQEDELISPEVQYAPGLISNVIELVNSIKQIKY